jgi:hypothetical protein
MVSDPFLAIAMNLLMILIILFAIMVAVCISYIAWEISAGNPPAHKTKKSGEVKESKDLPDS